MSDKKIAHYNANGVIDYYTADVVTANDYYPFGMQMPGRKYSQPNISYRYGFNGKELDKETTGTTTYDYGFRIYSPALGRFLSVDPLSKNYPWYTPYQFAGNKPIIAIDLDGLEEKIVVNSSISKVKPAVQGATAITIFDKQKAVDGGIHFIMSQLQLKEIQQKELVGPPSMMNSEFRSGYLTLQESEAIIKETVGQFTLQSGSRYTENKSLDLSVVTETYNVQFDFNYSLLGSENTISNVKEIVSKSMTVLEYAADLSGSDLLNKISAKAGIASSIINGDTKALYETAVTTIAEKVLANKSSFLVNIFAKGAPKVAEKMVSTLSLALTNSGPQSTVERKAEATENLRNRTVAALLILFETNNKTKTKTEIAPTHQDETYLPKPPNNPQK